MRSPVTSESRMVVAGQVDLAQRGAGEVDAPEGGAPEGVGVAVVGRHRGIVAEDGSDHRYV